MPSRLVIYVIGQRSTADAATITLVHINICSFAVRQSLNRITFQIGIELGFIVTARGVCK